VTANERQIIERCRRQTHLKPSERAKNMVNAIRHARMDSMVFDHTNNALYLQFYTIVMESISCDYPFLSGEVQRQVEKKKRWQARRSGGNVESCPS
jgi:hypothetical protein